MSVVVEEEGRLDVLLLGREGRDAEEGANGLSGSGSFWRGGERAVEEGLRREPVEGLGLVEGPVSL